MEIGALMFRSVSGYKEIVYEIRLGNRFGDGTNISRVFNGDGCAQGVVTARLLGLLVSDIRQGAQVPARATARLLVPIRSHVPPQAGGIDAAPAVLIVPWPA